MSLALVVVKLPLVHVVPEAPLLVLTLASRGEAAAPETSHTIRRG